MRKTVSIAIDNTLRSRSNADTLPALTQRWGVQVHAGVPADGTSAEGDPALVGQPTTDGGSGGSSMPVGCTPPPPAIPIIDDPRTSDEIGAGRDVFERLAASGSSYVPSLRVDFYRAVWFDGLEAYQPAHYSVSSSKAIVPAATLDGNVIVSARYVVR